MGAVSVVAGTSLTDGIAAALLMMASRNESRSRRRCPRLYHGAPQKGTAKGAAAQREPRAACAASGRGGRLVQTAVLHDDEERVLALQELDVGERIAVDEEEIGEVAGLDLAELLGAAHDLAAEAGGGDERLHGGEAEHVDEEEKIARVGTVRVPGEAVVAAGQHADAALAHLAHGVRRDLELAQEA